jgi:hypothetical protein
MSKECFCISVRESFYNADYKFKKFQNLMVQKPVKKKKKELVGRELAALKAENGCKREYVKSGVRAGPQRRLLFLC